MDRYAQLQLSILGTKSAFVKIQWPTRFGVLVCWVLATCLGILYPFTVGMLLFSIGFINYVLLLSFRINNNFLAKTKTTSNSYETSLIEWPSFSIIVPLKNESAVIEGTFRAIHALTYPTHLKEVIVVVEETDAVTQESLRKLTLPSYFHVLYIPELPPYTKGRALVHALKIATGEYVTVYDAESRPEPSQLQKAAFAFANTQEELCLQAKIHISNPNISWVSRQFAGEYYEWYERHMQELSSQKLPFGLGGNSFFVSKTNLEKAGAWDPFNVTEDAELSVRLVQNNVKIRLLESVTKESCPDKINDWINQRTRWNKGLFITQLVHLKSSWRQGGFGLEGWLSFWVPMMSAAMVPFFNIYIPLYLGLSDIPYPLLILMNVSLWILLAFSLGCSWIINLKSYRQLSIQKSNFGVFFDAIRYLFLHFAAGFKSYVEYFFAPMHWHKTIHNELPQPPTPSQEEISPQKVLVST
ncbi:glycosyltransferase [Runella zeae]|uniref:glycosyltransferase n=1 Tax=Runella zeae TaxID=94255 RepID=UPI002355599D|nr:glycosyltransferase [Runella zeae]